MDNCIFCGTEIEDNFCYECDETANDLGLDYENLRDTI